MLIKGEIAYREDLTELWHGVFGDDYAYIRLFFEKEYQICETFAEIVDGKIVSALYLLNCGIDFGGRAYNGRYLYAAATNPDFRSRGLMGKLINEALDYCRNNPEVDFICLVPANDGLYDYYGKFGFEAAFYRCEARVEASDDNSSCGSFASSDVSACELLKLTGNYRGNRFYFCEKDSEYALECVKYSGYSFYKTESYDGYFAVSNNDKTVLDFISDEFSLEGNLKAMESCLKGAFTLYSPYDGICTVSKNIRYGMIYPLCEGLTREWDYSDIYMNYALD